MRWLLSPAAHCRGSQPGLATVTYQSVLTLKGLGTEEALQALVVSGLVSLLQAKARWPVSSNMQLQRQGVGIGGVEKQKPQGKTGGREGEGQEKREHQKLERLLPWDKTSRLDLEVEAVCKLDCGICAPGSMCSGRLNYSHVHSAAPAPVGTLWSADSWWLPPAVAGVWEQTRPA